MRSNALAMGQRSIPSDWAREDERGLKKQAMAIELSSRHHSLDPTLWARCARIWGRYSPSVSAPIWRRIRHHAVGTPILDHDVSAIIWQALGRLMQSITTMMPMRQRG